jgi:lycopene cyclase-like protein
VSALDGYPYLASAILLLSAALFLAALKPHLRQGMLWAGVGCAPGALLTVSFVPVYWDPIRLGGSWIGLEDVIFSFATGSLMWFTLFGLSSPKRVTLQLPLGSMLRRYFTCGPLFALFYYTFRKVSYEPMDAAIAGMLVLGAGIAVLVPQLVLPALRAGTSFCLIYTAVIGLTFLLWPEFEQQWSAATISGYRLGPIPSEELAWAFVIGCTYPLVFAYVTGAESEVVATDPVRRVISR